MDAGYAQITGAPKVSRQAHGAEMANKPVLLWIDFNDFMIDQAEDVVFKDGIFSLHEKDFSAPSVPVDHARAGR